MIDLSSSTQELIPELTEQLLKESGLSNWEIAWIQAHRTLVNTGNTRDLGKSRQHATEFLVQAWIRDSLILPFEVMRQDELDLADKADHNESGWDLLLVIDGFRIQVKYRGGASIHLEQTRRSSDKNKGNASKTGHVVYSAGEFDVLVVIRPPEIRNEFQPEDDILVIPEAELRDTQNPGYLIRNIGKLHERQLRASQNSNPERKLLDLYNKYMAKKNND